MKSIGGPSCERLSALADGELAREELAETLSALARDADGVKTWHAYHVVGDVLRSAELEPVGDDLAFFRNFELRLAKEPIYPGTVGTPLPADRLVVMGHSSANASSLRWKVVAGLACSALAVVIGVGQWNPADSSARLQVSASPVKSLPGVQTIAVESASQVMIRDPALDSLLAAHQQLGGHSALQRPSGFLRNATYEGPAR